MCIIRLRLFVRRSDNSIPNGGQKKMNSARDVLGDAAFSLSIEQCAMGGCKCVNIRMGGEDRRRLCAMSDVLLWCCRVRVIMRSITCGQQELACLQETPDALLEALK